MNGDKLEILPASLLLNHPSVCKQFSALSRTLGIGLGWHYLLDFTWGALQLDAGSAAMMLDAGGGFGLIQWWLAGKGIHVISVDRTNRAGIPPAILKRYSVQTWPPAANGNSSPVFRNNLVASLASIVHRKRGVVYFYHHDLSSMPDIPDASIDTVISISALEHNKPDNIRLIIRELMRVLTPGGKIIATLGASKEEDWFHEPSAGWCFTEKTMREIFDLSGDCTSNYNDYDALFEALRDCAPLRDNLAEGYFQSGKNGMPWGIWNPKYQPVGVVKIKK